MTLTCYCNSNLHCSCQQSMSAAKTCSKKRWCRFSVGPPSETPVPSKRAIGRWLTFLRRPPRWRGKIYKGNRLCSTCLVTINRSCWCFASSPPLRRSVIHKDWEALLRPRVYSLDLPLRAGRPLKIAPWRLKGRFCHVRGRNDPLIFGGARGTRNSIITALRGWHLTGHPRNARSQPVRCSHQQLAFILFMSCKVTFRRLPPWQCA